MFEYLDKEIIVASILLIISIGLLKGIGKNRINWYLRILFLFAISLPFIQIYDLDTTASENIQSLEEGSTLKCIMRDNSYRISTKDGWKINKNYFTKDSLLIRADKCEAHD
jgi:hypothetical protein